MNGETSRSVYAAIEANSPSLNHSAPEVAQPDAGTSPVLASEEFDSALTVADCDAALARFAEAMQKAHKAGDIRRARRFLVLIRQLIEIQEDLEARC